MFAVRCVLLSAPSAPDWQQEFREDNRNDSILFSVGGWGRSGRGDYSFSSSPISPLFSSFPLFSLILGSHQIIVNSAFCRRQNVSSYFGSARRGDRHATERRRERSRALYCCLSQRARERGIVFLAPTKTFRRTRRRREEKGERMAAEGKGDVI